MTPEHIERIEELYHAVRRVSASERAAMLARTDSALREEVEQLLAQPSSGVFLDRPAIQAAPELLANSIAARWETGASLGPYRIQGKLGEGGMGTVFLAVDTRLGRTVAIKTMHEQFGARFQREARAISSLNHPNICTLYDVGPDYLVMELVEGETLAVRLKGGPLHLNAALLYASQIASALGEAHVKGIVHRDLKPGNIMIAKSGVKVLDFGLAAKEGDQTLTGERQLMGTPAYMAPEQKEGKPADARTDIFAFGCVLYEMLTGERAAVRRRRLRARRLENIVSRCMEEDPGRRWQLVAELQRELSAVPGVGARQKAAVEPSRFGAPKLTPRKIVLAEFENRTGDPAFDGILRQCLCVQLEQSSSLVVVSDQQMQRVLRLMNRPPETRLAADIAQEICERTGSTALLEGSIACLGSHYILWVRARNCRTGDMLAQEQGQTERKEDVLTGLTRIAAQICARLGESLASIEEHSTSLEEATTLSLEALKLYSAARNTVFTRGFAPAIPLLQHAIAIDPQFALAVADLGFYYWNMGQTDLGAEYVRRAYQLRDRVSDPERRFIHFLFDRQVTGNLQKELETLESWVRAYPSNWRPWGLLAGWGTRGTGQYERGIKAAEQCLRLKPDLTLAYISLFDHNLGLGRVREAAAALRRADEHKLELPSFLVNRFYLGFLEGDDTAMAREIDRARGNLETEDWMSHNQALVLARSGQMRNARIRWRHIIERQRGVHPEQAAIYQAAEAVCEAHCGNRDRARECARAALNFGKGRDVVYAAAFTLALSGDSSGARELSEDLAMRFPEDTPVQSEYLPALRALLALSRKAPLDAIECLQTATPYDFAMPGTAFFAKFGGLYPAYVRGQAYLDTGQGLDAATEFQKVLDHRGVVLADPIGALAHLQLARARVLSGDKNGGKAEYVEFLSLWKNADPDLPVLRQARAEREKLR